MFMHLNISLIILFADGGRKQSVLPEVKLDIDIAEESTGNLMRLQGGHAQGRASQPVSYTSSEQMVRRTAGVTGNELEMKEVSENKAGPDSDMMVPPDIELSTVTTEPGGDMMVPPDIELSTVTTEPGGDMMVPSDIELSTVTTEPGGDVMVPSDIELSTVKMEADSNTEGSGIAGRESQPVSPTCSGHIVTAEGTCTCESEMKTESEIKTEPNMIEPHDPVLSTVKPGRDCDTEKYMCNHEGQHIRQGALSTGSAFSTRVPTTSTKSPTIPGLAITPAQNVLDVIQLKRSTNKNAKQDDQAEFNQYMKSEIENHKLRKTKLEAEITEMVKTAELKKRKLMLEVQLLEQKCKRVQ